MTLVRDSWAAVRRLTPARVGLGRTGVSLPTARHLEFQQALALARDAVAAVWDTAVLSGELRAVGFDVVTCQSAAADRRTYLRRPDLGRRLSPESRTVLESQQSSKLDLVVVVADGLSAAASQRQAAPLVGALRELLPQKQWRLGPVVLVQQGRVAVGDEVGEILNAGAVAVLIGERPGLSAVDSLGAYVTWAAHPGSRDAERNCVSNIHPGGLSPADGARSLAALLNSARALQRTGIALSQALAAATPAPLLRGPVDDR